MTLLIWATFILYSLGLVALDLGLFHRRPRPVSVGEAMMWTTLWVAMALLFNFLVFFLYDHHLMGSLTQPGSPATGGVAALEFFLGYLVEKALSLDNLVAVALIFACFEVPLQYQHRLLFWGILGALVIRGLVVALGVGLLSQFDWIIYGFGILLLVAALRRLVWRGKPITPENNPLLQLVKRFFPATIGFHGEKFFITQGGVKSVTPLFMALVLIEATDLMFALDSIPAIFSITRDPFIIYSSNVFAVLGLRPLYFVLAPIIQKSDTCATALSC